MLDVEVLVLPTLRDENGLALSSRNRFLDPVSSSQAALAIPRALAARPGRLSPKASAGRAGWSPRRGKSSRPRNLITLDYVESGRPRAFRVRAEHAGAARCS